VYSQAKKAESTEKTETEKTEPATKLEQVLSKKGRLYLKDFFTLG